MVAGQEVEVVVLYDSLISDMSTQGYGTLLAAATAHQVMRGCGRAHPYSGRSAPSAGARRFNGNTAAARARYPAIPWCTVADVAVVAAPDDQMGEAPVAFAVSANRGPLDAPAIQASATPRWIQNAE